jgi:hypothetical protein
VSRACIGFECVEKFLIDCRLVAIPLAMLRALSHDPDDVEWRAADPPQTMAPRAQNGSLQQETSNSKRKCQTGCFFAPQMFGGGIYLPDPTTYDPVEILLNTQDIDERNELTKRWRDNKLSELNFVGVVVCPIVHYLHTFLN